MSAIVHRLGGEEWQAWADQLLTRHYGPGQYQKIPAKDAGDAGLEGFSLCGHAYQCYGVVEPVTTRVRYEKQRDKITEDIAKFINNRGKLAGLLGTVQVNRWCLFVPFFDSKEIVKHASTKTEEIKAAALPYVAKDFRVLVCDEDEFSIERQDLMNAQVGQIDIRSNSATTANIQEWAEENDELVKTLDGKVKKLPTCSTPQKRQTFRDRIIKHFLEGANILEGLRKYPQTYEKVLQVKADRENFLVTECLVATGSPAEILQAALREIKRIVSERKHGLSSHTAEALSWEAVADWLIRCPLDFPEVERTS